MSAWTGLATINFLFYPVTTCEIHSWFRLRIIVLNGNTEIKFNLHLILNYCTDVFAKLLTTLLSRCMLNNVTKL